MKWMISLSALLAFACGTEIEDDVAETTGHDMATDLFKRGIEPYLELRGTLRPVALVGSAERPCGFIEDRHFDDHAGEVAPELTCDYLDDELGLPERDVCTDAEGHVVAGARYKFDDDGRLIAYRQHDGADGTPVYDLVIQREPTGRIVREIAVTRAGETLDRKYLTFNSAGKPLTGSETRNGGSAALLSWAYEKHGRMRLASVDANADGQPESVESISYWEHGFERTTVHPGPNAALNREHWLIIDGQLQEILTEVEGQPELEVRRQFGYWDGVTGRLTSEIVMVGGEMGTVPAAREFRYTCE